MPAWQWRMVFWNHPLHVAIPWTGTTTGSRSTISLGDQHKERNASLTLFKSVAGEYLHHVEPTGIILMANVLEDDQLTFAWYWHTRRYRK